MRPKLKICGLMREEDVDLCCRRDVEICGFVTEYPLPVPWNLERERARELLRHVRGNTKSCVVSGGTAEKLAGLAKDLRPDFIQLHAGETIQVTEAVVRELAPLEIRVIKTIPESPEKRRREFGSEDPAECVRMLEKAGAFAALVDARGPENAAGSSTLADTELYGRIRDASSLCTILGGGIKSGNCASLIRRLHPEVLDVMTGVETAPGRKSAQMLDDLLAAMEEGSEGSVRETDS